MPALSFFDAAGCIMAKTNYSYEKRQRELAKKKKKEEKNQRKLAKNQGPAAEAGEAAAQADAEPGSE